MSGSNGSTEWQEGVEYNCRVLGVQPLENAGTGSPYLDFKLIVIDGEKAGEETHFEAYATDGSKTRLKRSLAALGFTVGQSKWDDLSKIVDGKECAITFKANTYNGKTTIRPDNLKRRSAAGEEGGVLGRIAALFGEKVTVAAGPKHPDVPF